MSAKLASGSPALSRLVERQMRNWELARSQRHAVPEPKRREVEDFVCVSRMVGADGEEVARAIGEALGWPVFDREVLEAMAGDDEIRRQIYDSMDQRDLSWWEETLRSLMQGEFVRNDYYHRLCETLLSLARQGHSVFLGRGADLVLPRDRGLRVRLVAPLDERTRRFREAGHVTGLEARQAIERIETQRARFFRRYFGVDVDDPMRFDLIINLARIRPQAAIELILEARRSLVRAS